MSLRAVARHPSALAVVVALIGSAVFAPALTGGWLYDDHLLIPENAYIHDFSQWPRWYMTHFWDIGEEYVRVASRVAYWRPFITTTYALDWQLSGGTPLLFHVMNLIWHGLVGALTFVVLRRWLDATWPAVVGALVFAVHPTKAESVAWISGRTDVICMVAVLMVTIGVARRLRGERGGIVLEFLGTVLAYTSKEQAIILPAFVAVEAWVHAGRPAFDFKMLLRMIRVAAPQIAIAVVYLALRKMLLPIQPSDQSSVALPLGDHVQAVFESIGRFAALTFAPHDLSIQQGIMRIRDGSPVHSMPYVVIGIAVIAASIAAIVLLRRRMPAVSIGITFFLVTLSPTSNIINTQMETLVSERFLYLPMLGIAFAVGAIVARWPRRHTYALAALVIVITGALAIDRSIDYQDEDAFWARELALHPESTEARRARVRAAIRERRYEAALRETIELTRWLISNQDVALSTDAAQLLADLTPDRDRESLEAIDAFCRDLLQSKAPGVSFELRGLRVHIPTTTKRFKEHIEVAQHRLLALRSSLRSRLGDDTGATALANEALRQCPKCSSALVSAALAFARSGAYDVAYEVLNSGTGYIAQKGLDEMRALIKKANDASIAAQSQVGPAALQARAAELAALELWGRAYDVLAPYKDQIKTAPKFVQGFAELAVRAGYPEVARDVLAGSMSSGEVEALIVTWAKRMGWSS